MFSEECASISISSSASFSPQPCFPTAFVVQDYIGLIIELLNKLFVSQRANSPLLKNLKNDSKKAIFYFICHSNRLIGSGILYLSPSLTNGNNTFGKILLWEWPEHLMETILYILSLSIKKYANFSLCCFDSVNKT